MARRKNEGFHEKPRWVFHPGRPELLRLAPTLRIYRFLKKHGYKVVTSAQVGQTMRRIFKKDSWKKTQTQFTFAVQKYIDDNGYMEQFDRIIKDRFLQGAQVQLSPKLLEAIAHVLGVDKTRLYNRLKDPVTTGIYRVEYYNPRMGYSRSWKYVLALSAESAERHVFDTTVFPYGYQIHNSIDVERPIVIKSELHKRFATSADLSSVLFEIQKCHTLEGEEES